MDITRPFEETRDMLKKIIQPAGLKYYSDLSSAELAILWNTYTHYSMLIYVIKFFEKSARDNDDSDVASMLAHSIKSFNTRLKWITDIFNKEKLPLPLGFSESDLNITAPQLYSNSYILYYVRYMIELGLILHTININMSARPDVRDFYNQIITTILEINTKVTNLMLARGILPRHPVITVQDESGFIKRPGFLAGYIGEKHPLLAMEVAHLYQIVLLNFIGRTLLAGFRQVAKSDVVRSYMEKGVRIADNIIETLTPLLKEDEIPAPLPGDAGITDSKEAPFSDKLMMFHVRVISYSGIGIYGVTLEASLRHDLTQKFALIAASAERYAEEGIKIMIDNGWMEKPPQVVRHKDNRKAH